MARRKVLFYASVLVCVIVLLVVQLELFRKSAIGDLSGPGTTASFLALYSHHHNANSEKDPIAGGTSSARTNDESNLRGCRLSHQTYHSALFREWMDREVPILVSVATIQQRPHVLFFLRHINAPERSKWMYQSEVYCNDDRKASAKPIPGNPKRSRREDGDFNSMVQCPSLSKHESEMLSNVTIDVPALGMSLTYNETVLEMIQDCPEPIPPTASKSTNVTVGMCTSIRGSTARSLLREWVAFHRLLGVDYFRIYVNEPWSPALSSRQLTAFDHVVTWIPFDFHMDYYRPNWKLEFSYFQTAINTDCLYQARRHGWDFVLTTDVDEFLHVTDVRLASSTTRDALRHLLATLPRDVPGWMLSPVFYGAHPSGNESTHYDDAIDGRRRRSLLDYTWRLKTPSLADFTGRYGRVKNIYRPWLVDYALVHTAFCRGQDCPLIPLQVDTEMYLQHYKDPERGPFRAVQKRLPVQHDDVLRRRYRDAVLKRLEQE